MSTDKSLKHLKSKDKFLIANLSNYFEKNSWRDSSLYIQQTVQATTRGDSPILKHFYFIYKFLIIRLSLQNIFYL